MLKVQDVFTLNKIIFMFDYIKGFITDELKRLFTFNYDIHLYIKRTSEAFHIPERNTTRFGINTLCFNDVKLWNKFHFELLNKETNLRKSKLNFFKNTFLTHPRLIDLYFLLFYLYRSTATFNIVFKISKYLCLFK